MRKYHFIILMTVFAVFFGAFAQNIAAQQGQTQIYYFSPGTESPKKALVVPFSISENRYIKSWHFIVTNAQGQIVRKMGEENAEVGLSLSNWRAIFAASFKPKKSVPVPSYVSWDGKNDSGAKCPDGSYFFYFTSTDDSGNFGETPRFRAMLDTTPPSITIKQPSDVEKNFGQGNKLALNIQQSGSREDLWTAEIKNAAGKVVRSFEWRDSAPAAFSWDGTGSDGFSLPDGVYNYSISAVDAAGNKSPPASVANIRYEATPKDAQAGRAVAEVAPNGNTKSQKFTLKAGSPATIESWMFYVVPVGAAAGAAPAASWPKGGEKLRENYTIDWNGKLADGGIAEGNFVGKLSVKHSSGATVTAETQPFLVGDRPQIAVTTSPELFSPDGDGTNDVLNIKLDVKRQIPIASWEFIIFDPIKTEKPFWTANGKSEIPPSLTWNGRAMDGKEEVESAMDYPFAFTVIDNQEQTAKVEGIISVDILVRKDGNRLIIRVPAINFRENGAEFDRGPGLKPEVIERNKRILNRVAAALQRYPDYQVTVEGHANNVTGTEKEEKQDNLGPLSQRRAEVVRDYLTQQGVKNRLGAAGIGGTRPVVDRRDSANRWKNRRVEFVLQK